MWIYMDMEIGTTTSNSVKRTPAQIGVFDAAWYCWGRIKGCCSPIQRNSRMNRCRQMLLPEVGEEALLATEG